MHGVWLHRLDFPPGPSLPKSIIISVTLIDEMMAAEELQVQTNATALLEIQIVFPICMISPLQYASHSFSRWHCFSSSRRQVTERVYVSLSHLIPSKSLNHKWTKQFGVWLHDPDYMYAQKYSNVVHSRMNKCFWTIRLAELFHYFLIRNVP